MRGSTRKPLVSSSKNRIKPPLDAGSGALFFLLLMRWQTVYLVKNVVFAVPPQGRVVWPRPSVRASRERRPVKIPLRRMPDAAVAWRHHVRSRAITRLWRGSLFASAARMDGRPGAQRANNRPHRALTDGSGQECRNPRVGIPHWPADGARVAVSGAAGRHAVGPFAPHPRRRQTPHRQAICSHWFGLCMVEAGDGGSCPGMLGGPAVCHTPPAPAQGLLFCRNGAPQRRAAPWVRR